MRYINDPRIRQIDSLKAISLWMRNPKPKQRNQTKGLKSKLIRNSGVFQKRLNGGYYASK